MNKREQRYVPQSMQLTPDEEKLLIGFANDYYFSYLQDNDLVTMLSTHDFFKYLIHNLDSRARRVLNDPNANNGTEYMALQKYQYL